VLLLQTKPEELQNYGKHESAVMAGIGLGQLGEPEVILSPCCQGQVFEPFRHLHTHLPGDLDGKLLVVLCDPLAQVTTAGMDDEVKLTILFAAPNLDEVVATA
jgi:hypothetical protein